MVSIGTLEAIDSLIPQDKSTKFPNVWLVFFLLFIIIFAATVSVSGVAFLFLVIAVFSLAMMILRFKSNNYQAAAKIRKLIKKGLVDNNAVISASQKASASWIVQAYAGFYFQRVGDFSTASHCYNQALSLFKGDDRLLLLASCECALHAGFYDYAISLLEPRVLYANPDNDDPLDARVFVVLSNVFNKKENFSRALEVANRLPLRKRNLDEILLCGLSSRAEAKIGLRKFADAKQDIDRIYATDPGFYTLRELETKLNSRK